MIVGISYDSQKSEKSDNQVYGASRLIAPTNDDLVTPARRRWRDVYETTAWRVTGPSSRKPTGPGPVHVDRAATPRHALARPVISLGQFRVERSPLVSPCDDRGQWCHRASLSTRELIGGNGTSRRRPRALVCPPPAADDGLSTRSSRQARDERVLGCALTSFRLDLTPVGRNASLNTSKTLLDPGISLPRTDSSGTEERSESEFRNPVSRIHCAGSRAGPNRDQEGDRNGPPR